MTRLVCDQSMTNFIEILRHTSPISEMALSRITWDEREVMRRDISEGKNGSLEVGTGDRFIDADLAGVVEDLLHFLHMIGVRDRLMTEYVLVGIMSEYGGQGSNESILVFTGRDEGELTLTRFVTSGKLHEMIASMDSKDRPSEPCVLTTPPERFVEWFSVSTAMDRTVKDAIHMSLAVEEL
ncbi:MAG: hypothetical protein CMF22_11825 [Idiomarinaceae bacterium]|nr:hypothetical protein [Idiomarinaceae bacterium]